MKQIASGRVGRVAATYAENAPMASACCNACRACVTVNAAALLGATLAGVGGAVWRLLRRKPR